MTNKLYLTLLWLTVSFSLFAGSVYDKYDNGKNFSEFDTLMNQVRFPTSSPQKMEKWVNALELAKSEFPDYPQLSYAFYFLGCYSLELGNYYAALAYLKDAKRLQPELSNSTPIDSYIADCDKYIDYRDSIITSSVVLVGWSTLILLLFLVRWKRKEITSVRPIIFGFLIALILVILLFSLSTASWSDGMADFYAPPTLVKSSLLSPGSAPLWKLLFVSIFSSALVAISVLAVKRYALMFSVLTALVVGSSATVLYYQFTCYDVSDRTGINLPKRVTFKETIIEWHKDVPLEMLGMYDKKLQLLILDAKEKAADEESNREI